MKVRPLNDQIIVERVESETKTSGGIIIPDTAKEKPKEGKVLAVGKGKINREGKRVSMELKAGDRVLFERYAGTEIKIDGKEYLMMREDDVVCVLE